MSIIDIAPWPKLNSSWWREARSTWKLDLVAGITVWGLVIPEAIAYTSLAGIKPVSGIWAIVLVLPFYALFGGSKELVATPTAATAVTAGGLIMAANPKDPANAMGVIAICTGVLFMLAYFLKLGFVVHFISRPINAGFMFGLACYLTISQLPKMLGFVKKGQDGKLETLKGSGNSFEQLWFILKNLDQTHLTALGLTALGLAIMFGLPKVAPRLPAGLVTLVVTTLLVGVMNLDVKSVGKIPTGFPNFIDPQGDFGDLWPLLVGSVGIVLLGFSEASAVATELAEERGNDYDPSRDLFAFGIGNAVSGFFGNLVGAGSMSSSATNVSAGGRTPMSSVFTSGAALLTGLFAGGLLANLPETTLGVLIVHAISHHLRTRFLGRIDRYSRAEMLIALLAAFGVLMFDVLWGLLLAMGASLIWFLRRATELKTVQLGESDRDPSILVSPSASSYRPLPAGHLAYRFSGEVYYGNVDSACERISDDTVGAAEQGAHEHRRTRVLLDMGEQDFLDYTTVLRLRRLFRELGQHCDRVTLIAHRDLYETLIINKPLPDHVTWESTLPHNPADHSKVPDEPEFNSAAGNIKDEPKRNGDSNDESDGDRSG